MPGTGWKHGGGDGGHRGGGEQAGGWQHGGGDRGAMINGDAGREAVPRGRDVRQQGEGAGWAGSGDGQHQWQGGNRGDGNRGVERGHDLNRDRNWVAERRDEGHNWSTDRHDWNRGDQGGWNRGWRNDRRYNWQGWRNEHRGIYRLPPYQARFGYSYRRWYPGYRWDPWYYSSTFWIADPWYYRLPPAEEPYRWVRYYDDAVLVDIYTGEIVDIIYNFFW
jgi:hypothetical protein